MERDSLSHLARIKLLSVLDGDTLRNLEQRCRCRWRRVAAKDIIVDSEDDRGHDVYFVAEGRVRIVNFSPAGREIAFANVREGGYFGELAALTDRPRIASVVAVTDCRIASLASSVFRQLLLDHPELGIEVIRQLGEIVQQCDQRIMDLSTLSAVQRVHVELLNLAEPDEKNPEQRIIRPLATHSVIASHASTTRETVARTMTALSAAGIVERKGRVLHIYDHERLSELVESGAAQMLAAR